MYDSRPDTYSKKFVQIDSQDDVKPKIWKRQKPKTKEQRRE